MPAVRDQVFVCYSHKDRQWLERLQAMLRPLVRSDRIRVWDDTHIRPGAKWREEIAAALRKAKVAVILVSQDTLASEFIAAHEMPGILSAAKAEGLTIIWVAVGYSTYKDTELDGFQAANDPAHPLESLSKAEADRILVEVSERIRRALEA